MICCVDNVHSKEDLQRLLEKEQVKDWDIFNLPLWRCIVVEDFSAESSYVIIYMNHCFTDGINFSANLKMFSDNSDTTSTRAIKGVDQISPLMRPILHLIYGIKVGLFLLTQRAANNPMKIQGVPAKEDRHMFLLGPYDLDAFTKNRRKYKASFVQTVHAMMA